MEKELHELKSVLRSLVVSSPAAMDARCLLRDYRQMLGEPIPVHKWHYRDPVVFLREKCSDCFLFHGSQLNPTLTLIVPETLKHIDKFVQKQKSSTITKMKGKRRSVPETRVTPVTPGRSTNLIVSTFHNNKVENKPPDNQCNKKESFCQNSTPITNTNIDNDKPSSSNKNYYQHKETVHYPTEETINALPNFLRKRIPLLNSIQNLEIDGNDTKKCDEESDKQNSDSGRHTESSTDSSKKLQLEVLRNDLFEILSEHPDGVLCTNLLKLYRERHGRELNFSRLGFTSVLSAACALGAAAAYCGASGDWRLSAQPHPVLHRPAPHRPAPAPRPSALAPPADPPSDSDDALPGIDFEPDVFPEDCMHFMESIPSVGVAGLQPGTSVDILPAEVYSPSHFWFIRLGEQYNIAMEEVMDEMNEYYARGEGAARRLALGAVRAGHYVAACYEGDWHRAVIVRVLDCDTVKVRHVDYGTVMAVAARELRPLPRRWAALPAQAVRARLAAVRPVAGGRRWPRAAADHLLRLVRDRALVALVVAVDVQEDIAEVVLVDTSGAEDVDVGDELVRAGHADPAPRAPASAEPHLYPLFAALEAGATPNFGEIHALLRLGIDLDCVEDYRRHVPPLLPAEPPPPPPPPPSPPPSPPPPAPPTPPSSSSLSSSSSPPASSRSPSRESSSSSTSSECPRAAAPSPPRASPPAPRSPAPAPVFAPPPVFAPFQPGCGVAFCTPRVLPPRALPPRAPPPQPVLVLPPPGFGAGGAVTLSAAQCAAFEALSRVCPPSAHQYMLCTLRRAAAPRSPLNPYAAEFYYRPPPGFQ